MRNPNIERLLFIKNLLSIRPHSKDEIIEKWNIRTDVVIVNKTVDRDVEALRDLGYKIKDSFEERRRYYQLVDILYENEILERYAKHLIISKLPHSNNVEYVHTTPPMKGIDQLPLLLESIDKYHEVEFIYHPFDKGPSSKRVYPLILKEYQGKWHMHGYDTVLCKYRTYGIDRIRELKQLETFSIDNLPTLEDELDLFKRRLGAARPLKDYFKGGNVRAEIIRLRISSFYLDYLKSKPVHPSQEITNDNVKLEKFTTGEELDYVLVNYYLVPNFDLVKFIVSGLGDIIIEEPKELKDYFKTNFKGLISKIA
jgi:predicted DNA-binding transcriptional regulator YafY